MIKSIRSWSKPSGLPDLIGRKKVDWSIFEYGSHIPVEFHEDFVLANSNRHLKVGEKHSVQLIINDKNYTTTLTNVPRKDSKIGAFQLRYDQNQELKQLMRDVFQTSYQYITEHKEEGSKKNIIVPDRLTEYIEFYQTDQAFIYKVKLVPVSAHSQVSFWWVNQGQTHFQEKEGEYLWAPQQSKQGIPLPHHVNLTKAKVNDIVFCYSGGELKCIGIVKKQAVEAPKPAEIASHGWQEEGYLLELDYFDFLSRIRKGEIPEQWRLEETGPFDRNGNVKQGYFFNVSEKFVKNLYSRFEERFPLEVKEWIKEDKVGAEMIYERKEPYLTQKEIVDYISSYIQSKGFYYDKQDIINLFLSLKTKPFVVLSGISGTGKTKIVQWFAESLGATEQNGQFVLLPVRPDWSDSSDLLGYVDIQGKFQERPLIKVLEEAANHPDKPYFVVLDEMNLARVEYYFSDFLSVIESPRWENGEIVTSAVLPESVAGKRITIPANVYMIGTVNMDETTHPLSKKVLDRANTIEFNQVKLNSFEFLMELEEVGAKRVSNDSLTAKFLHLKDCFREHEDLVKQVTHVLVEINEILEPIGAQVGYRVRDEICFYLAYNKSGELLSFDEALNYQIYQKILPRIAGSDGRTEEVLKKLYQLCVNQEFNSGDLHDEDISYAKYARSAKKLSRMLRRFEYDGFTSFWL
ncbi:AAA family ATPase [Bacillus sp. 165]|uniref:McrB family protein n=1 Tax=Bacillus sp. 165 TaxID=1529117 RepID=UPI001ADC4653|nr:AAA family ATPase [Bacillus sp. 165]MBO9128571.1 AAA family ATPase [Bacillus sp. 165]